MHIRYYTRTKSSAGCHSSQEFCLLGKKLWDTKYTGHIFFSSDRNFRIGEMYWQPASCKIENSSKQSSRVYKVLLITQIFITLVIGSLGTDEEADISPHGIKTYRTTTQDSKHRNLLWQAAAKPAEVKRIFKNVKLFPLLLPSVFSELGDISCSQQI